MIYDNMPLPQLVNLAKKQTALINRALERIAIDPMGEEDVPAIQSALIALSDITEAMYNQTFFLIYEGDDDE